MECRCFIKDILLFGVNLFFMLNDKGMFYFLQVYYKVDWKKMLVKGYDLRLDVILIVVVKSLRNIVSDVREILCVLSFVYCV